MLNRGKEQGTRINLIPSTWYLHISNIDIDYTMKLVQYTQSFSEPIRNQDTTTLIRLLAARNKTARGLSDTIGHVDVRLLSAHNSIQW
jgi:hypothetical protein